MNRIDRPIAIAFSVLAACALSWFGISRGLVEGDEWRRAALLSLPGLTFGLLVLPGLSKRWWLRVTISLAAWGVAFYGATKLFYVVGGGGPACGITGFWAAAALIAISLGSDPKSLSRNRLLLVASGTLWALGAAAIGQGVELNLDLPQKRPAPGRWFLLAGVVAWYLPFAVIRIFRPVDARHEESE